MRAVKDIFSGWEQLLDGLAGVPVTMLSMYSEKNVCLKGKLFKARDKMLQEEFPCSERTSRHSRWTSSIPAGVAPAPQIGLQYHREKEMRAERWLPSRHCLCDGNNSPKKSLHYGDYSMWNKLTENKKGFFIINPVLPSQLQHQSPSGFVGTKIKRSCSLCVSTYARSLLTQWEFFPNCQGSAKKPKLTGLHKFWHNKGSCKLATLSPKSQLHGHYKISALGKSVLKKSHLTTYAEKGCTLHFHCSIKQILIS